MVGFALCTLMVGCASEIGDSCSTSTDCSLQGDRICDRAQPGGYCTVRNCEPDTCPDGARCVEFRPFPERLAISWCMAKCGSGDDCRGDYECVTAAELGEGIAQIADEDSADKKFCAAELPE